MTTLFDAILEVAKLVEEVRTGITTAAGSTTTLVDADTTEPADFWNNGLLLFQEGALSGKTAQVIDYDLTTHTFTFGTQTAAPGIGVAYSVAEQKYRRSDLVRAVQQALLDIGPITHEDVSLTLVADQEEYDLPAGVSNLVEVEIATNDEAPYGWYTHYWWNESDDGHLRFDPDYVPEEAVGNIIKLHYNQPHASVSADSATISPGIKIELLRWLAAVNLYRSKYESTGKNDPALLELFNEAKTVAAQMMIIYAPRRKQKTIRLGGF